MFFLLFLALNFFQISTASADHSAPFPVLYEARFRPVEAYSKLWLYQFYHRSNFKNEHLKLFPNFSSKITATQFLWMINSNGYLSFQDIPLFWLQSAQTKKLAHLPLKQDLFSFRKLNEVALSDHLAINDLNKKGKDEWRSLIEKMKEFEQLQGSISHTEQQFRDRVLELQKKNWEPKKIALVTQEEFPIINRLRTAGSLFKSLPSRLGTKEWLPINALNIQSYNEEFNLLEPINNFTIFPDEEFKRIQKAFFDLDASLRSKNAEESLINAQIESLSNLLYVSYSLLEGKVYQQAHNKTLNYPSLNQLRAESIYISFPWIQILIGLYALSASLIFLSYAFNGINFYRLGLFTLFLSFLLHSLLLLVRCYILERPPVSNMFETVIYVPWVACCVIWIFPKFKQNPLMLLAAAVTSVILLVLLQVTDLNHNLNTVQAVLDSQFWLFIHVLMVVGSYGVFILGALLAHFYLALFLRHSKESLQMHAIGQLILQTLYLGTILLISGTILGGVWAAESWGRFWDWDPKESWAFISSCFYLIWIHAYRFGYIHYFGIAIGAIIGLLAISFTWYGVNYILGTGLHSYGFGSGGEKYYYTFLLAEICYIVLCLGFYQLRKRLAL